MPANHEPIITLLAPAASAAEVGAALPRFMRNPRNLPKLGRAQEAIRRLRDPRDRASLDLWYYPFRQPQADAGGEEPPLELADLARVPVYEPRELYSDLTGRDPAQDARPFQFKRVAVAELRRYDGLEALQLEPPLDR